MANNRLAYGLCKKYGIDLPSGATPQQAWEALKKKGVTQENASEKMSAPAGKTEEKSKGGTKGAEKGNEKAQKYGKMYLDYENKLKNAKTEDEIMDVSKQLDEKFGLEVRDNGDNLEIYDPKKRESVNSFAKNTKGEGTGSRYSKYQDKFDLSGRTAMYESLHDVSDSIIQDMHDVENVKDLIFTRISGATGSVKDNMESLQKLNNSLDKEIAAAEKESQSEDKHLAKFGKEDVEELTKRKALLNDIIDQANGGKGSGLLPDIDVSSMEALKDSMETKMKDMERDSMVMEETSTDISYGHGLENLPLVKERYTRARDHAQKLANDPRIEDKETKEYYKDSLDYYSKQLDLVNILEEKAGSKAEKLSALDQANAGKYRTNESYENIVKADKEENTTNNDVFNIAQKNFAFLDDKKSFAKTGNDTINAGVWEIKNGIKEAYEAANPGKSLSDKEIFDIAKEHSSFVKERGDLNPRNRDSLDFGDMDISEVEGMMNAAYNKGKEHAAGGTAKASKTTAKTGPKVHQEFIDHLKSQIGVDLTNARDPQFDNRKLFNIDTREITPDKLRDLKNYAERTQNGAGDYDVKLVDNGAYRLGIQVTKRK